MYRNILILTVFIIFFASCKKDKQSDNTTQVQDSTRKVNITENVKNIIYLTPSPAEVMLIINNANPDYFDSFLNPVSNADKYETTKQVALNLGIYTSDLSFLSMYEQAQKSINYVATTKKLADKLGLLEFINDSTLNEIQENMQNRDKMLNIITEVYDDINSYLTENNQEDISALIIFGAWVEGVYIAINLTNNDLDKNAELVDIIFDQKISLQELLGILQAFEDNKSVAPYYKVAKELEDIYSQSESIPKEKLFNKLKDRVFEIRNDIVSGN